MVLKNLLIYKVRNNFKLNYEELCEVFCHIGIRLAPNYFKTYDAVKYLLDKLEGNSRNLLVKLVNNDFEFWTRYRLNLDTLEDVFDCFKFRCVNKETEKYLIKLANEMQEKERNSSLADFKESIEK